jgi:stage V sporulation protein S
VIDAGVVNQAVKALGLATGYLKNDGINIICVPEFADVTMEDKVRTAIKLVVDPQELFSYKFLLKRWYS